MPYGAMGAMTIKIDNLQAYNNALSLSMTEAICGILETSMIHQVQWRNKEIVWGEGGPDPDWTVIENLDAEGRIESYHIISPAPEVEADLITFAIDGSAVVLVGLVPGCSVMFGSSTGMVYCGVTFEDDWGDVSLKIVDSADNTLIKWPWAEQGNMRISMKQVTNYKLEIIYKIISVYIESEMLFSFAVRDVSEATHVILRTQGAERPFSYLRVHDAGYVNDYTTLDPGENPRASLSRVVQGAPLTIYGRYDMSAEIVRSGVSDDPIDVTDYHFQTSQGQKEIVNYRELRSSVRLSSAYPEAEYYNADSLDKVGTQFDIAQNPYIITNRGAYNEAVRVQGESVKDFSTSDAKIYICPILEASDRVSIGDDVYSIQSIDAQLGEGSYSGSYSLRSVYDIDEELI